MSAKAKRAQAPKPWTGWAVIEYTHPDREPFWDEDNRLYVFTSRDGAKRFWEGNGGFGDWRVVPVEVRPVPRKARTR